MTEENQTPAEQEEQTPLDGKFLIEIYLEDGGMTTDVHIKGISTVEMLGIITYTRTLLNNLEHDALEKLK